MTKKELIKAILDDMDRRNDDSRETIERRWRGWLNRQTKDTLEEILRNRTRK